MSCLALYVNVTENLYSLCCCKNILSLEENGEWGHSPDSELTASSLYFIQSFLAHCRSKYRSEEMAYICDIGLQAKG